MPRSTSPQALLLVDDVTIKESFADGCVGINFSNGNFHFTFITLSADHGKNPAPIKRVVSARVVLTLSGTLELRDMLTQLIDMLRKQGTISTAAPVPPIIAGPPSKLN